MNLLIVGLGNFGEKYIRLLNNINPKFNIYVLRHTISNDNISDDLKIKEIFYKIEDTNSIKIDAVFITNPSTYHIETANYFIKKNISCMIEKPISLNYKDGLKLINNNTCCIQIGYLLRYSDIYKYLLEYTKYIGKILLIKINVGQYLPGWRKNDYRECVSSNKDQGGGVLLELSHDINYILGFIDIKNYKIKSFSNKISELEINVEDYCFLVLDIELTSGDKVCASINLDMIDHKSNRSCKLIGTNGSIECDFITKKVYIKNQDTELTISLNINENLLEKQTLDFLDKVQNNRLNNESLKDALLTLKIIDRIKKENNI